MFKQSILAAAVVTVGLVATIAVHAGQRERAGKVSKDVTVGEDKEITTFSEIAYIVDETGYIEVAGVVGFSTLPDGTLTVQVKGYGDFETDVVLRLPVRLFDLEDGALGVGMEYVREMRGKVEFGVRDLSLKDNRAIRASHTALANGCEGIQTPRGFTCINSTCNKGCPVHTDEDTGTKSCAQCIDQTE